MTAFFILILLPLLLVLWIVFTPVYLSINTDLEQYEIRQAGTLRISFHPWHSPAIRLRVFGFTINMTKKEKRTRPEPAKGRKEKWAVKRSASAWLSLQRGIFKSFRLRKLVCTVDLDDVVATAKMVPVVMLLNRGVVSFSTNFMNRNFLCLEIQGRVYKILWTTIRFFTKK